MTSASSGGPGLQGLGRLKLRGQARTASIIKSCKLLYRHGEWHVSITLECADADIAVRCSVFATEKLSIKNMTGSAAGTVEEPGKNVQQKVGLNREILDTAPAALLQKVADKVPEAGALSLEAPTRKLKPSQTCPSCGSVSKKQLQHVT